MAITPLPDAPETTDTPQQFNTKAFAWVQSLDTFVTEANAQAVTVNSDASAASAAKTDAEAAAAAAVAAAGATKWISGTTYDEGDVVWSPINYLSYRRKSSGGGTTDPSLDSTNWEGVAGTGNVTTDGTQTLTNKIISGASNTLTVDGTNPVGFKNIPQSGSAKTAAYTLATGDVGKFIEVGASGSIEIPDATFSAGDAISIFNNTTGDVTITCTITTAYIAGANADAATATLATRGICTILFISGTVCVISGNVS